MFYLVRNLRTCLIFSPHDMDKLNTQRAIIQMLRQKMEGLCFKEFGYIVKITKDRVAYSDQTAYKKMSQEEQDEEVSKDKIDSKIRDFLVSTPETDQNGIKVYVTFSAICFKGSPSINKAQKNDLIQFKVETVAQQSVIGYIGPVEVVAPLHKIPDFMHKKDQNIMMCRPNNDEKILKIDRGSKIKAKCINSQIEMNDKMKIVVEIPRELQFFIENDNK